MTSIKIPMPTSWGGTYEVSCVVGSKPGSRSKKITHVRVQTPVYASGTIDEFYEKLKEVAVGLEDAKVDLEDTGTYDPNYEIVVYGWREMTDEELGIYHSTIRAEQEQRENFERSQLERIKKEHPEWLKDDLI